MMCNYGTGAHGHAREFFLSSHGRLCRSLHTPPGVQNALAAVAAAACGRITVIIAMRGAYKIARRARSIPPHLKVLEMPLHVRAERHEDDEPAHLPGGVGAEGRQDVDPAVAGHTREDGAAVVVLLDALVVEGDGPVRHGHLPRRNAGRALLGPDFVSSNRCTCAHRTALALASLVHTK